MGLSSDFDVASSPIYVICFIGFLANLMLLIAFIKDPLKCFRNSATYLVANLAISDLLFNAAVFLRYFQGPESILSDFLQYLSVYLSMGTIFSISLDRFLIITYPFKHRFLISGNKMAIWIGIIWFSSFVHPVADIFSRDKSGSIAKSAFGSVLTFLTGLLYSKTYFVLRVKARSMTGKKAVYFSGKTSAKSISVRNRTWAVKDERICEVHSKQNLFGQINGQNNDLENEHVKYQKSPAGDQSERGLVPNERKQNYGYVENQDGCAQNQDERISRGDKIVLNQAEIRAKINANASLRQQEKFDASNSTLDDINQNVFLQNPSIKCPKPFKVINTAKEQKFLNTIILSTFITVVTLFPSTIYFTVYRWHEKDRPEDLETHGPLAYVFATLFCLNFVANPFVYCWRLKKYRKSLKQVYCYKS